MTRGLLMIGASLLAVTPALAQEAISELVVTGAPYAVSIDSAATHVEVLRRDELEAAQPAGLGDMLANLPGLRSTTFGPGASRPVIRGQSGPRVQVLQNGVGLVDASTLSPDHAVAADPQDAIRIEVLRGPSTLAYGGSAIGGVVNVIDDRIATSVPEKPLSGRLSGSVGGPGDGRAVAGGLVFGTGPLVFTLDANHHDSEDYKTPTAPVSVGLAERDGLTVDPRERQFNTAVAFDAFGAGVSLVGDQGYIGVAVKQTDSTYGVPFAQITAPIDPDAEGPVAIDLSQIRADLRGEHKINIGPFARLRGAVGYADYEHAESDAATGEVGTRFLAHGTEARFELMQDERDGWQGAIGVQGLKRSLEAIGDEAFIPASDIEEQGAFILQRKDFGGWGLEGGLRLDRRAIKGELAGRAASDPAADAGIDWTTADADQAFNTVSGSAAVFWRPTQALFLAVVAARNERAPTEFELFADGPHPGTGAFEVGDPTIGSEKVASLELTARWKTGRWRIEGHLFSARYDGFIDQAPTGDSEEDLPVFQFVQTDARFTGGEIEIGYDLWQRNGKSIGLDVSADYVRARSDLGAPARIPPASVTARLTYDGPRLSGWAQARTVDNQHRLAAYELPTGGYTTFDAQASWRVTEGGATRVFIEGRNRTNQEVREHVSFLKDIAVQPGRSLRAGFAARF